MRTTASHIRLCAAALLFVGLGGCSWFPRRGEPRPRLDVRPLSEAGFDIFAAKIAQETSRVLRESGHERAVTLPSIDFDAGGVELVSTAGDFTRALASGLTDRMGGALRFGTPTRSDPPWKAFVRFSADAQASDYRTVTFRLLNDESGDLLVAQSYQYGGPRGGLATPAPRRSEYAALQIDYAGENIGEYVRTRLPQDERQLERGRRGVLAFLKARDSRDFRVLEQRMLRAAGGTPRAEFDIEAVDRLRDARLRVVFFDDRQRYVGSSIVMPYRFAPDVPKTVVFSAPSARATQYVCLFESE